MNTYDRSSKEQLDPAAGAGEGPSYSPAQRFFLARIERLVRLREEYEALLRADDWESKLLTKATYSTYCDCVQLGVGAEARERLAKKTTRAG